ncbi:hypothetical protein AAG906_019461 [Vitis piasezkii]
MENLSILRDRLISMEDMGDFKNCLSSSHLDGSHELRCTLLARNFDINVNWDQFVLDTLVAGIRHFRLGKGSWFTELQDYDDFGLVDMKGEDAHEDPTNPVDEVEEETSDEIIAEYNVVEKQIHQLLRTMKEAIDKLAKRHNKNKTPSPSHQSGSHNQPDINESFHQHHMGHRPHSQ